MTLTPSKILASAGLTTFVVVAVALLVAALQSARRPQPTQSISTTAMAVTPEPPPARPPAPAAAVSDEPSAPSPTSDEGVALRLARTSGPALTEALWAIEQQSDPSATMAGLRRNAGRYRGRLAVFRGEVLEIQDIPGESGSFLRVSMDHYGEDVLAVFTYVQPDEAVVSGRRVRVYGRLMDTFSYQSQAGWNLTIPRMNAVAVVLDSAVPRRPRR